LRAHSTALNNNLAANSQTFSIPISPPLLPVAEAPVVPDPAALSDELELPVPAEVYCPDNADLAEEIAEDDDDAKAGE
jgi:hypothetical protein